MPYRTGTGRRRKAKVDSNQTSIVDILRLFGFSVKIMSQQGKGFPDLIVGALGYNYLVEVKNKTGKLTKDQIDFINIWQGEVIIIREIEDFLKIIERDHGVIFI